MNLINIQQFFLKPWIYLIIILTGVCLKFYRLDYRLFWFDEICTIQHTTGISDSKFPDQIPKNEVKNINFYHDLYHLNKQHYGIGKQLKGLFSSTQLTPLHYSFLMVWYRIFGDNYTDFRLFSVFIFIITLPLVYLLAKKLFNSSLAGYVTTSLFSISPFIHLYAQEARYYMLWVFFLVAMHYFLLKALERKKIKWWILYTITGILSMYTSPFTLIIIFGHIVYVSFYRKEQTLYFWLNILIIILFYSPWILSVYFNRNEIVTSLSWHKMPFNIPFVMPLMGHIMYSCSIFVFNFDYSNIDSSFKISTDFIKAAILNVIVIVLLIKAFIFLGKKSAKDIFFFLIISILPGILIFFTLDIFRNGIASMWWRYLIFYAPGVLLVMSYLLYKKIENGSVAYFLIFLMLVVFGLISILTISNTRYFYLTKRLQQTYIEDAAFISKAKKPLLITDYSFRIGSIDFMVLMQECKHNSIYILRASPGIKGVEKRFNFLEYSDIYLIHASKDLVQNMKSQFGSRLDSLKTEGTSTIYRIKKL